MANMFYVYLDDDANNWALQRDDALDAVYHDLTGFAAPTAYADLAALQAAHAGVVELPNFISPRSVTLQIEGFPAASSLPLTQHSHLIAAIEALTVSPTANPNVAVPIAESHLNIIATSIRGEQRNIQAP
jgi:hypothetical protein